MSEQLQDSPAADYEPNFETSITTFADSDYVNGLLVHPGFCGDHYHHFA
jgi:hypothetical protein